jgi:hypothetical protein
MSQKNIAFRNILDIKTKPNNKKGYLNSAGATKKQLTIRAIPWMSILMTLVLIFAFFTFWSYRLLNFWSAVILLSAFISTAYFGEFIFITLDRNRRSASFKRIRVWHQTKREITFGDLHTISVEETRNHHRGGKFSAFNILFVLKTGESFRLENFSTSSKTNMIKTVQIMVDFINERRSQVMTALDGIVRIKRDGITRGTRWQIEFVANNDRPMITRWKTDYGQLSDGFLLVTPNSGGMKIQTTGEALPQGGWANIASSYELRTYLETMDLTINDIPGFNNMKVIKCRTIGLNDQFNILTDNIATTQTWFDFEKNQTLLTWMQTNPLKAERGNWAPHFLVTPQGFILFFRGNYPDTKQVESITQLGLALTRS